MKEKNVFILGAGFSAPVGAPVIRDFLDRARSLSMDSQQPMDETIRQSYEAVFNYRMAKDTLAAKAHIDLDDIENLFSVLELESEYLRPELLETKKHLIYMIVDTLNRTIQPDAIAWGTLDQKTHTFISQRYGNIPGMPHVSLHAYFTLLAIGALAGVDYDTTFISFNYDLLLDNILQSFNVQPDYALAGRFQKGIEASGDLTAGTPPVRTIPLLKLHGSANWAVCSQSSCDAPPIFYGSKSSDVLVDIRSNPCPTCHRQMVPLMVPPTWNKGALQARVKNIWKRAVDELRRARRIFFIGYSLRETDSYFRYLLALALEENRDLEKIYVVDSDHLTEDESEALRKRYEGLVTEHFRTRRLELCYLQKGFDPFMRDHILPQAMHVKFP